MVCNISTLNTGYLSEADQLSVFVHTERLNFILFLLYFTLFYFNLFYFILLFYFFVFLYLQNQATAQMLI